MSGPPWELCAWCNEPDGLHRAWCKRPQDKGERGVGLMDKQIEALLVNTVPANAACAACRWWGAIIYRPSDVESPHVGFCRRHAPVGTPAGTAPGWPQTEHDAVCGDYEDCP